MHQKNTVLMCLKSYQKMYILLYQFQIESMRLLGFSFRFSRGSHLHIVILQRQHTSSFEVSVPSLCVGVGGGADL